MRSSPTWSTSDAALEASIRLRAGGYPHATVRVRNLLNLEACGAVGPWPRDPVNGRRRLTDRHVEQLVRYYAGHFEAQGKFPSDDTPVLDPEDGGGACG